MFPFINSPEFEALCSAARAGDRQALGSLTELFRPYLLRIASDELNPGLQAKFGKSDMVQQALFEAQQAFCDFAGTTEKEFLNWMRRILRNNLIDESRRYFDTDIRDIKRELSLDEIQAASMGEELRCTHRSTLEELVIAEKEIVLKECMGQLPGEFQQVIHLRHVDSLSFAEIGKLLNKSEEAARKTWFRALQRLRRDLKRHEEFGSSAG